MVTSEVKILVEVTQADFDMLMDYVANNLQWDSDSEKKAEMFERMERFVRIERAGAYAVAAGAAADVVAG